MGTYTAVDMAMADNVPHTFLASHWFIEDTPIYLFHAPVAVTKYLGKSECHSDSVTW